MKKMGVVSWKLPPHEMSCHHFRNFPPEKITMFNAKYECFSTILQFKVEQILPKFPYKAQKKFCTDIQ